METNASAAANGQQILHQAARFHEIPAQLADMSWVKQKMFNGLQLDF